MKFVVYRVILYNIHFGHIADIGEFATLGNIHNNSNIILLHKKSFKLDIFAPLNYEIPIKNDYISRILVTIQQLNFNPILESIFNIRYTGWFAIDETRLIFKSECSLNRRSYKHRMAVTLCLWIFYPSFSFTLYTTVQSPPAYDPKLVQGKLVLFLQQVDNF